MLKNRSKAFAPKFKGARRPTPASTPSSARPSVEPQSNTPAPESSAQDTTQPAVEKDVLSQNAHKIATPTVETTPQTESSHPPRQIENPPTQQPAPASNSAKSKRKATDEEATQPPAKKRTPLPPSVERNASSAPKIDSHSQTPRINGELIDPQLTNQTDSASSTNTSSYLQEPTPAASVSGSASEDVPPRNELQPMDIDAADTGPSPRSTSPQSDHGPPQFRYPTPEGSAMSAVNAPRLGAAGGDLPGLGPAGDINSGAKTGQVAQASQIVPMAGLNPDGSAAAAPEEPVSAKEKGKKKQVARRKKVQAAEAGDDARATVDMQINRPRRTAGAKRARKKKDGEKKRRARAVTPEGAEDEIIDQGTMTMGDLCKELKTGKKFSKHDEIKQRVVDKKIKDKMARLHPELIDLVEDDAPNAVARQKTVTPPPNDSGIRMRVVDGQLVMDDTTAVLDRHQKGKDAMGNIKEVVEDEFSRITNNATFGKREKALQWDYAATEIFYNGLRQFGTDFESIAKMLPPRSRRQIKLKFTKEEKNYPDRINKALTGEKVPIDLEEWEKLTGLKLEDVSVIEEERARIDREHAAEDAAHIAEYNAAEKQKKAEIQANRSAAARRVLDSVGDSDDEESRRRARASGSSAPAAGTESAKENDGVSREASAAPKARRKTAKDKAKKRNINSANGGGDEFEVLGEVTSAPSARYVLDYNG